ncbi:sensor histidine kinase [Kribbella sandramycini]|uniref:Sensor histidine kinase n=1 Tax=Kribbella sandramycini TaxID=60450 RepID=A0A7Y4NZC4_9ACTN|nr:sensor histidine kinase [Kribbella sandramycini]MBB6567362.1 two-component system sensor histidine kinase DesK [Kribbella sandramycini]NOL40025.1 sensor histidine kinase [Kribbella sandramycini]
MKLPPAAEPEYSERRGRLGFLAVGVWLFYLGQPLQEIAQTQHGVTRVLGLINLLVFAASYLGYFFLLRWQGFRPNASPLWQRLTYLGAMLALALLLITTAGQTALTCLVYIGATAMVSLDIRLGVVIVALLLGGAELSMRLVPGWSDDGTYGLAIFLGGLAVFGMRRAMQRGTELAAAREDMAKLAVQEERNRFARDLHDILGHSLTVITVKAELAGRLIQANPERAATEVADVESLARAALADVRAAVAGYRELSLAGELVAARAALQAAEIKAELPTTMDEVPEANRELFAWVIREGVTNVVRHSGAKRCTIKFSARRIEVLDDGRGPAPGATGHGLMGLRERADAAGATVEIGPAPGGGFRLAVEVTP